MDWTDEMTKSTNSWGGKGRQRKDREDRTLDYRLWRFNMPRGLYTTDVDQVEWRVRDGEMVPVAILELTRIDGDRTPVPNYFKAILDRYEKRDSQKHTITHIASRLGVDAFIVAYLEDLSEFMLYNLSESTGWEHMDKDTYQDWIKQL